MTRYRLVFRGNYVPGFEKDAVMKALAVLFRRPEEQIRRLLAVVPSVLKKEVSLDEANRYLEVFAQVGLITHLEEIKPVTDRPVAADEWSGEERRQGQRRKAARDRREGRRTNAIQPDRRSGRGRRATD